MKSTLHPDPIKHEKEMKSLLVERIAFIPKRLNSVGLNQDLKIRLMTMPINDLQKLEDKLKLYDSGIEANIFIIEAICNSEKEQQEAENRRLDDEGGPIRVESKNC